MQLSELAAACRSLGCEVEENAPMALCTSFRIGGPADLLVTAPDAAALGKVRVLCREKEIPLLHLGNGTNMLVSDKGIRGVVLRQEGRSAPIGLQDSLVICPAGVSLKRLCLTIRSRGLSGLEFAYGIPGTVGGAVNMNAGAYGGQISDAVEWAEAWFPDEEEIRRVPLSEMALGYRHSIFMDSRAQVTAAAFRLKHDSPTEIGMRMDDCMRRRREKQPLEYPSAGSFFKRPPGHFAGALIESSGLMGCTVGGAQVSEKHAGFIINKGGATCEDVRRLADTVIDVVFKEHGVTLEPEVCYVGESI